MSSLRWPIVYVLALLKVTRPYSPPSDLISQIEHIVNDNLAAEEVVVDWMQLKLNNPGLKFKLLKLLEERLGHGVPNSRLHQMLAVADVDDYYLIPVGNTTSYTQLARDATKPQNLHIIEHAIRFHPDDKEAYHCGVTAFPGVGGKVVTQRNKRLRREFNPKQQWFDYANEHFDYTKTPEDAPWDPKIAKRMDRMQTRIPFFRS